MGIVLFCIWLCDVCDITMQNLIYSLLLNGCIGNHSKVWRSLKHIRNQRINEITWNKKYTCIAHKFYWFCTYYRIFHTWIHSFLWQFRCFYINVYTYFLLLLFMMKFFREKYFLLVSNSIVNIRVRSEFSHYLVGWAISKWLLSENVENSQQFVLIIIE